jgi:hypothetical protein
MRDLVKHTVLIHHELARRKDLVIFKAKMFRPPLIRENAIVVGEVNRVNVCVSMFLVICQFIGGSNPR